MFGGFHVGLMDGISELCGIALNEQRWYASPIMQIEILHETA